MFLTLSLAFPLIKEYWESANRQKKTFSKVKNVKKTSKLNKIFESKYIWCYIMNKKNQTKKNQKNKTKIGNIVFKFVKYFYKYLKQKVSK